MSADECKPSDVFHPVYRELSGEEKDLMAKVKEKALELYELLVLVQYPNESSEPKASSNGREVALAKTKLEEAVMWAVKGITK